MIRVLLSGIIVLACTASVKSDLSEIKDVLTNLNSLTLLEGLADLDYSSPCINDTREYLKGLTKGEEWALKMFDSSAKIPDGFLMGNGKIMGQYGECIKVEHPEKLFDGQHCMLAITLNINLGLNSSSDVPDLGDGGGEDQLSPLKPGISGYGVCVPSSCSAFEIETGLDLLFNKTLNGIISIELDEGNCRTKEPRQLKDTDWAVIGILIAFGVIACLSTIYDLYHHFILKNGKPHPLLTSFSIYSNGKFLFQISENAGQLKALHGIRVFSISWVVLCHAYMVAISGPVVNLLDIFSVLQDKNHVVIINGFVSVDSFFFLSGLLVCIVFFRDISKKGYYDVPLSYIHRYIRLTPPYAIMILIMSTIILYMGDGPLWNSTVEPGIEVCQKSWWSGILYVQSFVEPNSNCLGQSWYLSTDMQMYWLSPLVLYPMYLFPAFAPILIGLLILVAVCGTFVTVYVNDLGASLVITTTILQMDLEYTKFYSRATPYLVGIATGYLICGIQTKKIKIELKPVWVLVGWLLAAGITLGSLYGIVAFTDYIFETIDAAFYVAFHRLGWSLGLAWVVIACVLGYGGPVNTLLSWNIFQPLGKLSYNVFLVHGAVQIYRMGSYRTNIYIGDSEMTNDFLADLVLSNLLAIPLTLIFEMPFGNIDRYLFRNVRILPLPRPKKTIHKKDENKEINNNEDDIEKGNVNNGFEKESE